MKRISLFLIVFSLLAGEVSAQEIKWPVFFLRYEGGADIEELDEANESPFDSQRHKITLRIKEQLSDSVTTNLYSTLSWKYAKVPSDEYTYFYLNPNFIWDINERLRWRSDFRSKWTWDAPIDTLDSPSDLLSLRAKTELTFKVMKQLKIIPSFQSVFDVDTELEDRKQVHTAGLRLESKINPQVKLNARYRAILQARLGEASNVTKRDKHEFGINLSWDPNK
jgi:hypothetical protein